MNTLLTPSNELLLAKLGIEPSHVSTTVLPEKIDDYIAVINWLTDYEPKPDDSNLERVQGYLEAFHHLCEVEAWEKASQIIFFQPASDLKELHEQLGIWGYYREQIELYYRLLGKLPPDKNCILLHGLGWTYSYLGQPQTAIKFHQELLESASKIHNRKAEAQAQGGLGRIYCWMLGQSQTALLHYQQQLEIAREINDFEQIGFALYGFADVYRNFGKYQIAIKYLQQALEIARRISDEEMELDVLSALNSTYISLGKAKQGVVFIQKQLEVSEKFGNRRQQSVALHNLGMFYLNQGEHKAVIEYFQKALEIVREVGDQHLESTILNSLGAVYIRLPIAEYQTAIDYCQQSLNITNQVGDYLGQGLAILNLSYCYGCSKQHDEAIKYSEQAMNIADEISNGQLRGFALVSLANTYWHQKQYFKGLLLATRSMLVLQPWKNANAQFILNKALEEISQLGKRIITQLFRVF